MNVPPLRERLEDVPLLVRHFVDQFSAQSGVSGVDVDPAVCDLLSTYTWPGNVRELRNIVERTIVRLKGHTIAVSDLPNELRRRPAEASVSNAPTAPAVSPMAWEPLFDQMVSGRETFWSAVYEPFMTRDVTRYQIREIVARGLERTSGDYRELAHLFNIADTDFKRFVGLLRRYDCHVALQPFQKRMMKVETLRAALESVPHEESRRFGTDS
jgi:DNA-binding NtrC family response regulator